MCSTEIICVVNNHGYYLQRYNTLYNIPTAHLIAVEYIH